MVNQLIMFKVIVNDLGCIRTEYKQFRFPKSKKLRIRKKWMKRENNFRLKEVHNILKLGNLLIVSTKFYEKLK